MNNLQSTYYFNVNDTIYIIDQVDSDPAYLALIETFKLVEAYEEKDETRKLNTFYIWYKDAQQTFKGEITINNLVGWPESYCFVGFGDTVEQCLKALIVQFSSCQHIEQLS